jgi:hypothetical protein
VSMRGWRRTGQGALVGCSGAGEAQNCRRGAAEVADDGEQSRRRCRAEKKPRGENAGAGECK